MTATKTKSPPTYGPDLPITAYQIKAIMQNCQYNVEIKDEWVQWATADVTRTSLKSINQAQAVKIIRAQTGKEVTNCNDDFEWFDAKNPQHKYIQSMLHSIEKTKVLKNGKIVADWAFFAAFLRTKSPIKTSLKQMNPAQTSKVIFAFEKVVKHQFS